jgi:two-component system sensor histidine kinase ChiS
MVSLMKSPLLFQISVFILCALFLFSGCGVRQHTPRAVSGQIDLSGWDFERNGNIGLDGEWEFYWQQLIEPVEFSSDSFAAEPAVMDLPKFWNRQTVGGEKLPKYGYATYRLRVRLPEETAPLGMRLLDIHSAYKLWINGRLMLEVGEVGTDLKSTSPCHITKLLDIPSQVEEIEIVLQVASFHHRLGGVADKIILGEKQVLVRHQQIISGAVLFVVGSLFIMGIYHLVLYLLRPKDLSPLYFGIICLIFSVWEISMNPKERFLATLFPGLTWERLFQIDYLAFILCAPAFIMFIHSLFPKEARPKVLRVFQITALVFTLSVIALPGRLSIYSVPAYQIIAFFALIYMIVILLKAAKRKRDGSVFLLLGFALFLIIVVNDILYDNRIVQTGFFTPWAIFFLVLPHSFVVSIRFSRAFAAVEKLSGELEEKNIALSRLDTLKDEFLAKTSHELRTPLNGIIGLAESLINGIGGKISEIAASNLSMIASSGKRLANLVSDILDFSRLKNRDIELRRIPVDIHAVAEGVLGVTRQLAAGKNLELINDIPPGVPAVMGDENRLHQVLFNLVGNAVKFTDQGRIVVSAISKDSFLEISVSDTGIGIPAQKTENIFQSFEQVDASDARAYGGTGLGLSITRQLVELHGGRIRVDSQVDEGSTFFFTLPVSAEAPASAREKSSDLSRAVDQTLESMDPVPPEKGDTSSSPDWDYQVLIVDDDPVNLQVAANHLSLEGISFQTVQDGAAALSRVESGERPRVVLLDIMMPKITGFDVCQRLRKTWSASMLPIIMLTAGNRVADLVTAYEAGANDYISKPFTREELIARVKCHLDFKDAWDAALEKQRLEKALLQQKQEKEAVRLRAERETLEKLRYQLNPHFLFNALASIRGAVVKEPEAAYEMISHLSEFSRFSLSRGSMESLSVSRELEGIRHYLAMEQMRLGGYLTVSMDVDSAVEEAQVPAFMLQPLVENAIKYGSRTSPDALDVSISIKAQPTDQVRFEISNTGEWVMPGTTDGRYSTGTGIKNIRARLERYYPGQFGFESDTDNGRVTIRIDVPRSMGPGAPPDAAETDGGSQ